MTLQLTDVSITALNNLIYFGLGLAAGLAAARILIWIECRATGSQVPQLTRGWWIAVLAAVIVTVPALMLLSAT